MVRPKDLGDQFPSDIGDTAPVNPTAGFSESIVPEIDGKIFQPLPVQDFDPEDITPHVDDVVDKSYPGKILEELSSETEYPKRYRVVTHDGRVVDATLTGMTVLYEYGDTDEVTVYDTASGWVLRGQRQYKQLSVRTLRQSVSQLIIGTGKVDLGEKLTDKGEDLEGKITIKQRGLYLVTFNAIPPHGTGLLYGIAYGEDWQETATSRRCWVAAKQCDKDGTILTNDSLNGADVFFDRPRSSPNAYDPELYQGDIFMWQYDYAGRPVGVTDVFKSKLGDIKHGSWDLADIPTGWFDANGTTPAGSKIGALLNFTGRGGRVAKYKDSGEAIGDHVGYQYHGTTLEGGIANNHPDHGNHRHAMDMLNIVTLAASGAGAFLAVNGAPLTANWSSGVAPLAGGGASTDLLNHLGQLNVAAAKGDTDNMGPRTVVHIIQRYK